MLLLCYNIEVVMTEQDLKEINFNTAVLLTYLEVLNGFSIWHQEEKHMVHVSIITEQMIDLTRKILGKF